MKPEPDPMQALTMLSAMQTAVALVEAKILTADEVRAMMKLPPMAANDRAHV